MGDPPISYSKRDIPGRLRGVCAVLLPDPLLGIVGPCLDVGRDRLATSLSPLFGMVSDFVFETKNKV